jgi:ribosomal subunit interface protein
MNKKITFRHMDHSEQMEAYINKQLEKVEKFLSHENDPISVDLVLEPSKKHAHDRSKTHPHNFIELRVKSPHYNLISNYEGPDFYAVLDRVIDTMYRELHEAKRKRIDDRKQVDKAEAFKKNQ